MFKYIFLFTLLLSNVQLFSAEITGTVEDDNGLELIGANIQIVGTTQGTVTDVNGNYTLETDLIGDYRIKASYIGYDPIIKKVKLEDKIINLDFILAEKIISTKAIEVTSDIAKNRETPIAYSQIKKQDIEIKLGAGEDLPMLFNEKPGFYGSHGGGAAGETRIRVRGFQQRNVAVMINGVPVNDMENGFVYWSNWSGIDDVTAYSQLQRGLGASKIANPSVGGTINIVTDAAMQKQGVQVKQQIGSGNYFDSRIIANTGLIDNTFAMTLALGRENTDGIVDMTWSNEWSYYLGLSYNFSQDNQLDFYLFGSPQQHGRNSWRLQAAYYDHDFAREIGMTEEYISQIPERGRFFNINWGRVDNPGQVYEAGNISDAKFDNRLNESVNFYHKPHATLNWYYGINDDISLSNVAYFSTGDGGGSRGVGPPLEMDPETGLRNFQLHYDIHADNIYPQYSETMDRADRVLANSMNNHIWLGWLGTVDWRVGDDLKFQFGGDYRYYIGEHYREIRSLLGGDYFVETVRRPSGRFVDSTSNRNIGDDESQWLKSLGDKIGYDYDSYVQWAGTFFQTEYKFDDFTTYINLTASNTGYRRVDRFQLPDLEDTDWINFFGYTAKFGGNYNISDYFNIYTNIGYYSKPPLMQSVFSFDNTVYTNNPNEKVLGFELGVGYTERNFDVDLNAYYTEWGDRSWSTSIFYEDEESGNQVPYFYNLTGVDALHMGVELEVYYKPFKFMHFRGSASFGDWTWQNNVTAIVRPDNAPATFEEEIPVYVKGLKVGDSPQQSFYFGWNIKPIKNSYIYFSYIYFREHYSDFSPAFRNDPDDRGQSWKAPNYGVANLTVGYNLYEIFDSFPIDLLLRFKVRNLLNEMYISDADDAREAPFQHDANSARIYLGLPRMYTFEFEFRY